MGRSAAFKPPKSKCCHEEERLGFISGFPGLPVGQKGQVTDREVSGRKREGLDGGAAGLPAEGESSPLLEGCEHQSDEGCLAGIIM